MRIQNLPRTAQAGEIIKRGPLSTPWQRAFTLVELRIVIAIITVLAAALWPNLIGLRGHPHDVANAQCHRTLLVTLTAYKADNGHYPTEISALGAPVERACVRTGVQVAGHAPHVPDETVDNHLTLPRRSTAPRHGPMPQRWPPWVRT